MLKSLSIRNVILIDKLDLDLQNGFTVLSGETGAGKSILLDSLGLVLGHRADVGMIRQGCDKLAVSACFEISDKHTDIYDLCREYDLDIDREIIIKRTLSADGRGKIFFNDQVITQKFLKEIGGCLVEVHGQFDNQGLLNPTTHLRVLDNYGNYAAELKDTEKAFKEYKAIKDERLNTEKMLENARLEEENMQHWVQEFAQIKPRENEVEELEKLRHQMMNSEKILESLNVAYKALNNQNQSVRDALRQAQSSIAKVNVLLDDKFAAIYELLDTALVNTEEAGMEIENALNKISVNQNEVDNVEERLFALKDLARKHHTTVENLPEVWKDLQEKLEHLEHGEDSLLQLKQKEKELKNIYVQKAEILHNKRVEAAKRLDANMAKELPDLKMEKAKFMTQVKPKDESLWNENGYDEVCFEVSTNPGMPFGALSKIASGGELARFMLALKVNLGYNSLIDTMIFDEVDTGIGGATAQAVGDKLAELGKNVQVLVVTHSPQVAAKGNYHYKVEKSSENSVTTTKIRELVGAEKREEIARMLSGEVISDEARAAAEVLIGA